jgi:zinc/manganese transport system substrate-binding protein
MHSRRHAQDRRDKVAENRSTTNACACVDSRSAAVPPSRIRPLPAAAVLLVLLLVLATATACGTTTAAPATAPAESQASGPAAVRVVASTDVYGSIVRAVGGDRVEVRSIIDSPDADPHEYEATPADAAAVTGAQILVLNGGGYDDFATRLAEVASPAPTVVNVVELSGLEATGEAGAGHAHEDGGAGHEHGVFNEHVWYSLPMVKKLADRLAADLAAADPAGGAAYRQNASAFTGRVDGLIGRLDAIKTAHGGSRVAVTEPVPGYLVQDAGLLDATPAEFSEAVEEGTDPPAAVLGEMLQLVGGRHVAAVLVNTQTANPATDEVGRVASAASIPLVTVTETLPEGTDDYVAWQDRQIDELAAALDADAA